MTASVVFDAPCDAWLSRLSLLLLCGLQVGAPFCSHFLVRYGCPMAHRGAGRASLDPKDLDMEPSDIYLWLKKRAGYRCAVPVSVYA